MSDRIAIASRKGLFLFTRRSGEWALTEESFLGCPVTNILCDRRDGAIYAALNLGHFGAKLHRSDDDGKSWTEMAMPSYPVLADTVDGPTVKQLWTLQTAGDDRAGALWAGTIPGGLFYSPDRGATWILNDPLWTLSERQDWSGGGYDDPGIHSICVDPVNSQRIAVAVSTGGVWLSEDGGESWVLRTTGMRAAYLPPELAFGGVMQDPHLMVQCCSQPDVYWVQHHNAIFKSTDALTSWQELTPAACPNFGFAVAVHPKDADTAWFVPALKDEYRYPQDGKFIVSRTRDGGRSFDILDDGLPQQISYDLVYRHSLDVDASGERLVMGSTTGGAWVSENGGDHWSSLPVRLPPIYAAAFV